MKTILILSMALSLSAHAKLNDFNALIEENSKAQAELHTNLKSNLKDTMAAVNLEKRDRFVVDNSNSMNVPTRKGFLTYTKNKTDYKSTISAAQKRLAQEIESSN